MLETLNTTILDLLDPILGWLLYLPTDGVIIVIALLSAGALTALRVLTTNQDRLRRCQRDKRRLRELQREARRRGDREARDRYRATNARIGGLQLRAEAKPLLAAIVPILLLATWCLARLGFHPLQAGEAFDVAAYFPLSSTGQLVHIVPREGLLAEDGWIREIAVDPIGEGNGLATWRLRFTSKTGTTPLMLRLGPTTYEVPVTHGGRIYEPPRIFHDDRLLCSEVKLQPVRFLGLVPGVPAILLPPWLVAYVLLVIPASVLLKRALGVA
jgi:uncharacterized membrane protein (DUF106 family)